MLAGRQHATAGEAHKRARVLVLKVVELGVFAVFTGFGLIDKAVVVVNHPAINLTRIDRFHHGAVAFIGHEVGFHRLEPFQGGLLALQGQHRAHDSLEIRA